MSFYKIILTPVIIAVVTIACAPRYDLIERDPKASAVRQAKVLLEQRNYQSAADIFQQLANSSISPERERFQLQAVLALINAGNSVAATQIANSIDSRHLAGPDRSELFLLLGRIELDAEKPQEALDYWKRVTTRELSNESKLSYHQSRAAAFSILGNLLESAQERVNSGVYLQDPAAIEKNNVRIMETLRLLPERTLIALQPSPPNVLGGWMSLARIVQLYSIGSLEMTRELDHWRSDFPGHPATESFIQVYLEQQFEEFKIPDNIAVLLPQSGPYAALAKTIREGIITAYYDQNEGFATRIHFFDTHSDEIYSVYQQAVAQGADFVIGPLKKENLRSLVQGGELAVPVLALNRLDQTLNQPSVVEFGLSPEDEAEQAASSAWFDGYNSALVLTPSTNFGHRLASHFSQYWQNMGGEILEVQTYKPKESDFSTPIKQLLDLDESEQRFNRLKNYIWDVKFEPRRRHDVDFIFVVAQPREARLIRPQLQFYRASRVPVYATSHVFSGHHNPSMDQDLSEIVFCDIPWLLDQGSYDDSLDASLHELRQQTPSIYLRLIALGFDAFNVIPHLNRLRRDTTARYNGLTGTLSINKDNRIRRQLHCAQFENGTLKARGLAPHLKARFDYQKSDLFSEGSSIETER